MQPAEPENLDVDGLLRGIYLLAPGEKQRKKKAQILASGVGVNWALKAQKLLQDDWGVSASVWSVTSWNELRRDGLAIDSHNLLNPNQKKSAYITSKLADSEGPVIAVSDFMRAVQDQIAPWVPNRFKSLGTDGFVATLAELAQSGEIKESLVSEAISKYRIDDVTAADAGNTEGSG
jgi:pyruvate dehydrogenase E1 component